LKIESIRLRENPEKGKGEKAVGPMSRGGNENDRKKNIAQRTIGAKTGRRPRDSCLKKKNRVEERAILKAPVEGQFLVEKKKKPFHPEKKKAALAGNWAKETYNRFPIRKRTKKKRSSSGGRKKWGHGIKFQEKRNRG